MQRLTTLTFCLLTGTLVAAPGAAKDGPVVLDMEPAAAPVPALRYQLLPEATDLQPGNAYPAYLKAFAEQNQFFFAKESVEERERLQACPLSDIKPGSLRHYGGNALRQADHAARLEYCDWNVLPQIREHGYALLIPEVQQMRTLGKALIVRGRGQVVDRDFDGAVRTLQTLFALARHLGDHPTVIAGLVGAAITNTALNLVEEFVQQPGAPNLYWALTGLPTPIVDFRKGLSADRKILEANFGHLTNPRRAWNPDDVAAASQKAREIIGVLELSADDRKAGEAWLRERVGHDAWLAEARKGLVSAGYPTDAVGRYPAEQVMLFHLLQQSRIHADEALKWMPLPYWQAEGPLAEAKKAPTNIEDKLVRLFAFEVHKIRAAQVRLEQRIALLRVVEAIRLHAAAHGGKLPESLTNMEAPVPIDPASGKAFGYKRDGLTAVLSGREIGPVHYTYEVRLRK